mmetsp:Transcript_56704/g.93766  ORF Transcript_56704/g.93766 Transcript_56704/m.93766 type:complete len:390 (+) Transcript_56704:132-1301(+)|eukprot:CAMPEP_0119325804 /NCGR_PEP_ID=MMETSP1333-20130426/66734_1 /TAXON_ID=418940 /ORGANISM="Scyphosphaera apsteinii, Strain RCC1455" /LENGTH=389 /DNA_ID=CAMNT_0007333909 /DNA_START=116 /DNA_END=1285 /DNA_ORIENTATION=+
MRKGSRKGSGWWPNNNAVISSSAVTTGVLAPQQAKLKKANEIGIQMHAVVLREDEVIHTCDGGMSVMAQMEDGECVLVPVPKNTRPGEDVLFELPPRPDGLNSNSVLLRGLLQKKSPRSVVGIHVWQTRWFELSSHALHYWDVMETSSSCEKKGTVDLSQVVGVRVHRENQCKFDLLLKSGRLFQLAAPASKRNQWTGALQQALLQGHAQSSRLDVPQHSAATPLHLKAHLSGLDSSKNGRDRNVSSASAINFDVIDGILDAMDNVSISGFVEGCDAWESLRAEDEAQAEEELEMSSLPPPDAENAVFASSDVRVTTSTPFWAISTPSEAQIEVDNDTSIEPLVPVHACAPASDAPDDVAPVGGRERSVSTAIYLSHVAATVEAYKRIA